VPVQVQGFYTHACGNIAAHTGLLPVNEGFQWLASWPAMICFGTATCVEILAYYIPFIDNLLDTITTPLAIVAGTLLLTAYCQLIAEC